MTYLLPSLFVLETLVVIIGSVYIEDTERMGIDPIMNELYFRWVSQACLGFMVFLSPSFWSMVFYYLAFLALIALSAIVKGTTDRETLSRNFDFNRHSSILVTSLLFYLLQKRELKRFF